MKRSIPLDRLEGLDISLRGLSIAEISARRAHRGAHPARCDDSARGLSAALPAGACGVAGTDHSSHGPAGVPEPAGGRGLEPALAQSGAALLRPAPVAVHRPHRHCGGGHHRAVAAAGAGSGAGAVPAPAAATCRRLAGGGRRRPAGRAAACPGAAVARCSPMTARIVRAA